MAKYPCPSSQDVWKRIEIWTINKFSRVNPKVLSHNNKEGWLRWAWTIKYLLENDNEWIYVDKFTVLDKSYKPYGWSLKGKKSLCSIMLENFKVMFIVVFSSKVDYSILRTTGTRNSAFFSYFLKMISDESKKYSDRNNKVVVIWDNASIHKSQPVRDLLRTIEISMLTVTPDSPWLNLVESFIESF